MARKVVRVSSNPNPTPAKGQPTWSWSTHAWNSREGTGPYGEPTFDNKKKVDNIKINSNLSTPKVSEKKSNRNQKILDKLNRTRTRNQGGITSSGGKKNVTPVYRNMGIGVPPGGTNFPNTLNQ